MKKRYITIITALQLVVAIFSIATGCKKRGFLDPAGLSSLNKEITFRDSANTIQALNYVYQCLEYLGNQREVNQPGAPSFGETTDEADTRWPGGHNITIQIINGNYTGNWKTRNENDWKNFYNYLRMANVYLASVDESPIPTALKERTKLEARFLKAWCYHLMMRNWGGIPIVGDTVYALASPNVQRRWDYSDCVDYLVKELDELSTKLPASYSGIDYGRVTRGAAMALKARVLLYAASPLFNGGSLATEASLIKQTAYPTADPARWQKALDAAQALVGSNLYQLEEDNITARGSGFYKMFLKRVNSEYILAQMRPFNKDVESSGAPPSRGGSFLQHPTQELVDAFPMKDGKAYTASPLYNASAPYNNRDPRFYFTVVYNTSLFFDQTSGRMQPLYTYQGATRDGIVGTSSNAATLTGYYRRKMMDTLLAGNSPGNTERCIPLMRYAEVLLNLAEAANEVGQTSLAMDQIKKLRKRAGIDAGADNNYGLPAAPSQSDARNIIRNERFIELAFEEQRYYDLRRWKLGDQYDGQYTHGMRITLTGPVSGGNYTYTRINIRPRYFKTNSYLLPIPQSEISINPNLLQNPGW